MPDQQTWYKVWFNSPYYHLLYKHRNVSEAEHFIRHLTRVLHAAPGAAVLDLGCGKGRHCILLHELGFDVTGIDLSAANIEAASKFSKPGLQFYRQDMRVPLEGRKFDLILNLFTSFGYFEDDLDHLQVLNSVNQMLNDKGLFVLDFMNSYKTLNNLVARESKIVDHHQFDITRFEQNGMIVKRIVVDQNEELTYEERVRAFTRDELTSLFLSAGIKPEATYGSYDFQPFDEKESDRLIIIARKQND